MLTRCIVTLSLFALTACASGGTSSLPAAKGFSALRAFSGTGAGKITHVIYVIQENRSFDNLFQGYPGADTVSSGSNSHGQQITLQPESLSKVDLIDHSVDAMFAACNGTGSFPGTQCRMNGFNKEESYGGPTNPQYVYVPHKESKPYFDMAHEWVVGDRMFQSQLDESFVAHQYAIAAQAQASVDVPFYLLWGCAGGRNDLVSTLDRRSAPVRPHQQACFDYMTLGDELDAAGAILAILPVSTTTTMAEMAARGRAIRRSKHIFYGPDWSKRHLAADCSSSPTSRNGKLANFTWITPVCANSDHLDCGGGYGPSWVASLVNAVGESKFWDSTAIFVQWDDWGGHYDHVPPPYQGLRRLGLPRSADGDLTVRQKKLRFAHTVRNGERLALRRGSLRIAAVGRRPTRARTHRPATASTSPSRRARSCRSRRPTTRSSSSATISERPATWLRTTSEGELYGRRNAVVPDITAVRGQYSLVGILHRGTSLKRSAFHQGVPDRHG